MLSSFYWLSLPLDVFLSLKYNKHDPQNPSLDKSTIHMQVLLTLETNDPTSLCMKKNRIWPITKHNLNKMTHKVKPYTPHMLIYAFTAAAAVLIVFRRQVVQKVYSFLIREDLVPVGKHIYELTYYHKGKQYRIQFPRRRGPPHILRVTHEQDGTDITSTVMPFMGPFQDFHIIQYIPDGMQRAVFHTQYGTTQTYHQVLATAKSKYTN